MILFILIISQFDKELQKDTKKKSIPDNEAADKNSVEINIM